MALQYVEPFVSDRDISAGDRWAQKIAGELESANFGIICVTPENLNSDWILFEAGALSKSMLEGKVVPLLFDLEFSDLSGPLSQFQAQKVDEAGIMAALKAINDVAENKVEDWIIDRAAPALWRELEEILEKIPKAAPSEKHERPMEDILEELVTDVRGLNSSMQSFGPAFSRLHANRNRTTPRFDPHSIERLFFIGRKFDNEAISLLLIAGYLRNDIPWLSEVFAEAYREIRHGRVKDVYRIFHMLHELIHQLCHDPEFHELTTDASGVPVTRTELPFALDANLSHLMERLTDKKKRNTRLRSSRGQPTD